MACLPERHGQPARSAGAGRSQWPTIPCRVGRRSRGVRDGCAFLTICAQGMSERLAFVSPRSARLSPSPRRPSSRSACATRLRIAWAVGSNSRAGSSSVRSVRSKATRKPSGAGRPVGTAVSISAWWIPPPQRVRGPRNRDNSTARDARRCSTDRASWPTANPPAPLAGDACGAEHDFRARAEDAMTVNRPGCRMTRFGPATFGPPGRRMRIRPRREPMRV